MIAITKVVIGDVILGKRYGKKVKGEVTKIHNGSVVIMSNGNLKVIDADKIIKILKQT